MLEFFRHDFIGSFSTTLRELQAGPGTKNNYEVRGVCVIANHVAVSLCQLRLLTASNVTVYKQTHALSHDIMLLDKPVKYNLHTVICSPGISRLSENMFIDIIICKMLLL